MSPHRLALLAVALFVAACGEGSGTFGVAGSLNTAKVRLVNATSAPLDLLDDGVALSGATGVASLGSSTCINVNLDAGTLSVRQTGTTSTLPGFTPTFATGGAYTVVAYPNGNGGVQFATMPSNFTTANGQAGLRVFDGAPTTGTYDLYVTAPGAQLVTPNATNLGIGSATTFMNVTAGSDQIRFTNFGTVVVAFDAGNYTLLAGQSQIFVLAAPNGNLAGMMVPGC